MLDLVVSKHVRITSHTLITGVDLDASDSSVCVTQSLALSMSIADKFAQVRDYSSEKRSSRSVSSSS